MAGETDLVQQATERLEAYKSDKSTAAIKRLTREHGLSDEVQLALRLLAPEHLGEILAGGGDLRWKLSKVPDKNKCMRSLISMLDPDVEALVSGLQALEQGDEQGGQGGAAAENGGAPAAGDDVLAEAQRRLAAHKSATTSAAIKRFTGTHGLGDEVQLALRMLEPSSLEELLAGEQDIRQKLAEGGDRDELMLSLISMLDADVVSLVKGLQALEQQESAPAAAAKGGDAARAQELVAEAERRLAVNKTATSKAAIERFAEDYSLSESVQLALQLLSRAQLEELLAGEEDLQQKFAEVEDRDRLMMDLVRMLDPEVEELVSGLQQVEGQGAQDGDALVAEAQRRLDEYKSPLSTAGIKRMAAQYGLGEEVQLALRLLAPGQFKEVMAGGRELQQKLQGAKDKDRLMLDLVKMLDPEVDRLVQGLLCLDRQGAAKAPAGPGAKRPAPTPPLGGPPAGKGLAGPGPKPPGIVGKGLASPSPKLPGAAGKGGGSPQLPGAAPTTSKASAMAPAVAPTLSKAAPAKQKADDDDWGDDWGSWGSEPKRRKAEGDGDGDWKGWKDDSWKGGGDGWKSGGDSWGSSWKSGGDGWKSGGDGWKSGGGGQAGEDGWKSGGGGGGGGGGWKNGGGGSAWRSGGEDNGWKSEGKSWKEEEEKWPPKAENGHADKGKGKGKGKGKVPAAPADPKPVAVPAAVVEPRAEAAAPAASAPAAADAPAAFCPPAGGGAKKKLKCMVCKGDHRAADCPKMK